MAHRENPSPITPLDPSSRDRFGISTWIFLRLLALIHLVAFISFWTQLSGLIGPHGILPAADFLHAAREQIGRLAFFEVPTLAWIFGTGAFLHVLCAVGVTCAMLAFCGVAPAACFTLLWICYLSLTSVSQVFLSFQWDALLLETTLFAIFLAPRWLRPRWQITDPSPISRWLLLWLLFRLMLLSGVVKLFSGDPAWRSLTALTFHYETQPLPTPLAWWAHQLPVAFHRAVCASMFAIELLVPWFLFAPRALRHVATLLLAALQCIIALTGNYAFFNFLTIALCLLALDNAAWRAVLDPLLRRIPERLRNDIRLRSSIDAPQITDGRFARLSAIAVVLYTTILALPAFNRELRLPGFFYPIVTLVAPFNSLNNYGLFAVMTTSRPELIFEGSDDGRDWRAYELPYKPGDLAKPLSFVAPHQPRLDWQLWFAALGSAQENPWVLSVCEHLLHGTPEVLRLFARNPFPDRPPLLIRVARYDYHYGSAAERSRTGHVWRRTPLDFYVEPVSLR